MTLVLLAAVGQVVVCALWFHCGRLHERSRPSALDVAVELAERRLTLEVLVGDTAPHLLDARRVN